MAEALIARIRTNPTIRLAVSILAVVFVVYEILFVMGANFVLYTLFRSVGLDLKLLLYVPDIQQSMALLLGLVVSGAILLHPPYRSQKLEEIPIYDCLLALLGFVSLFYLVIVFPDIVRKGYVEATVLNIVMPLIAMALIFEASRRVLGVALPVIALSVALLGLYQEKFNIRLFVNHMYYAREGIFTTPLFVMVSYVFAFVFFGSILEKTGLGKYITDFVLSLVGRRVGGPAKTAVVASALMGTMSGSSVANVLTTGVVTIPLMKRAGYPPEVAGAVEPAASTGGQIMPPVMGAAAFVMAEFLGRPYRDIIIAAAIPAILYFTSVYIYVDRFTKKLGIKPLRGEELPSFRRLLPQIYLLAPIPVIAYLLLVGFEPQYAALTAAGVGILASWISSPSVKPEAKALISALATGAGYAAYRAGAPVSTSFYFASIAVLALSIAIGFLYGSARWMTRAIYEAVKSSYESAFTVFLAASCAGIIQGTLTMTGWATEFGYRLVDLVGWNLYLTAASAMAISLVLGMGVPTTANYIITTTISGAALARVIAAHTGLPFSSALLAAHMFVFYFGIMADLTPPVALASYAGSMLAGSEFWKTAINATIIASAGYLVPYIFIQSPELLILTVQNWDAAVALRLLYSVVDALATMLLLSAGIVGWHVKPIPMWQRGVLVALGVACLAPIEWITAIALAVYIALYFYNKK